MNTDQYLKNNLGKTYEIIGEDKILLLFNALHNGDSSAMWQIISTVHNSIIGLANRYFNKDNNEYCDLLSAGIFGAMKAVDRFSPEKKIKFHTYATWWISAFIRKEANFKPRFISLNKKIVGDDNEQIEIVDTICDKDESEETVKKIIENELIEKMKIRLTEKEKKIIYLRFYKEKTLEAIGNVLGISHQRVSQNEIKAVKKMRTYYKLLNT